MLNEETKDIIKELLNIYIGHAASLLSEMVNKKINLSIPQVNFIASDYPNKQIMDNLPSFFNEPLMASTISFGNKLVGNAKLFFSTSKVKQLVMLCTGEYTSDEELCNDDFSDIDLDVLKEIGNVILNSFLGGFSNLLEAKLNYTNPYIVSYQSIKEKKLIFTGADLYVLVCYVSFNIDDTNIDGAILCTFTFKSRDILFNKLEIMKDEYYGS